jgi:hypothetical protein
MAEKDSSDDCRLALGQLADHIDALVHELGELLGNPHSIAANAGSAVDESTQSHKVRADERQERGHRTMSSEAAGFSRWSPMPGSR